MNFFIDEGPIIACSTGNITNTAIALVRLSGFKDLSDLQIFFDFNLQNIKPRYSHLVNLVFQQYVFDNCMIVYFPAGKSFTGENVLELHLHGNKLNVNRIIDLFVTHAHFRIADPGEFSFRAFKNKKLTISQIEGLDLFLNASNPLMLDQGLDILQGQLHKAYLDIYDLYLRLKSSIELLIDFAEDVGEKYAQDMYHELLQKLVKSVAALYERTRGDLSSFTNPEIVIVGETNAGKSSFFNLLLSHDRSIVSNIKGTTRDYISETIFIDSYNFGLVDTAGIRETVDEIEKIGISRSFEKIRSGFFKILLINPFDFNSDYCEKLSGISFDLILFSHADLSDFPSEMSKFLSCNSLKIKAEQFAACSLKSGSIGPFFKLGPIGPDNVFGPIGPGNVFGPIGPGNIFGPIGPKIRDLILAKFKKLTEDNPIMLERHRQKINQLHNELHSNIHSYNSLDDLAIISSEINRLGVIMSDLIGQVSSEDVLNSVFKNFCIGK